MPPSPVRKPLGAITTNPTVPTSDPTTMKKHEPASKKRKASEPAVQYDIDDEICQTVDINCNAVRAKIRRFLESGEMKVGEFQRAIGTNSKSYHTFMNQSGPYKGNGSSVYGNAFAFFKHRELNGVKIAKKAKVVEAATAKGGKADTDFEGIMLEGEEENEVPVYDSCDEIRKKIRKYLRETNMSQAAFSREIAKSFHPEKKVSGLAAFMAKKGPAAGNTSSAFYGSYVFFEKMRVRDRKPKTEHRLGMEDAWDGCEPFGSGKPGMDTKKMIDRESYIFHSTRQSTRMNLGRPLWAGKLGCCRGNRDYDHWSWRPIGCVGEFCGVLYLLFCGKTLYKTS
ncbi:uncharacterized protein LY89DRAFT_618637 [Mollisia scopiformis]|uniref:DUF7726 domain-containing protein n=1 Tax=Mollisia scopiformis TaxID=149040 RepID=A0A194X810_MOLSC|nr:uncharacterized protein LY89DRAFT_618637 [Mollisia scopiformis]KUJ15937.1 hypothetical protein LY89DRAFT_618637 [Mollisia scopiformis]